jgi:hypothetical protein
LYGVEAGRVEAAESHHNKNKGAKMQTSDWIAIEISVSSINEAVRASHKNPKRAFHPSPNNSKQLVTNLSPIGQGEQRLIWEIKSYQH